HEAGWFDAGDRRSDAGTGGKRDSQQVAKPRDRWRSRGCAGDVDEQERNAGAKQRVEEIDHPGDTLYVLPNSSTYVRGYPLKRTPGLRRSSGSSARLMARMAATSGSPRSGTSQRTLATPIPCSALTAPPIWIASARTASSTDSSSGSGPRTLTWRLPSPTWPYTKVRASGSTPRIASRTSISN